MLGGNRWLRWLLLFFNCQILYGVVFRPEHGDQVSSAAEASVLGVVTGNRVPLARENEKVRKALVYVLRFLASKVPERSEPRAAAVESILEIVKVMEEDRRYGNGAIGWNCWGVNCLKALIHRCDDSMGGIRARALTNFAQVIGILSGNANSCARVQEIVLSGHVGFKKLLRERCVDEKAAVRKGALLIITKATALIGRPIDQVVLKTMAAACSDPLVSIQKASLMALSEVYRRFPDDRVISEWFHAVPPLIVDNETSIQEECENLFLELVLDRISITSNLSLVSDTMDLESVFPEGILDLLKGICDGEVAPCIKKICASLGKKKN